MIDKDALVYNIDFFLRAELTTQRSKTSHTFDTRMPDRRTDARRIRKPPCLYLPRVEDSHVDLEKNGTHMANFNQGRSSYREFRSGMLQSLGIVYRKQMTVNQRLGTSD
ncbi:hypothetical protein PGTUg99_036399 [Puccinia graminis f. sp. tritici]|uniref:Uncharacterized protein n=1 Tax=Puccinia graminis f. sp. tritici TaxID=56615 RepID=A0A5B0QVD4_PUCGR|nr:hypothetical protein PGTUg99_036399 [Puccinia graminis f. sp. tritici]